MLTVTGVLVVVNIIVAGGFFWWVKSEIEGIRIKQFYEQKDISIITTWYKKNTKELRDVEFRVEALEESLQGDVGEIWSSVINSTGVEELREQMNELEANVYDKYIMENLWEQNEATKDYAKKQKRKEAVLSTLRDESPVHSVKKVENLT